VNLPSRPSLDDRSTPISVVVEGQGLHTGKRARVTCRVDDGPLRLRLGDRDVALFEGDVVVDGASRSTTIASTDGVVRVGTVEHLFAALGALGLYDGLVLDVEGPEIPLLDGGARAFVTALRSLSLPKKPPRLVVAREGAIAIGESLYEFRGGAESAVEVEVDFGDPRLERRASWRGDADDFVARIAPARTFGFAREVEELLERGLASHVDRESVVVLMDDRVLSAGAPFLPDEPARHKLLDLVGDLFVHGGPPRGHVRATRPGHAATHEAMRRALADEIVYFT